MIKMLIFCDYFLLNLGFPCCNNLVLHSEDTVTTYTCHLASVIVNIAPVTATSFAVVYLPEQVRNKLILQFTGDMKSVLKILTT